MSAVAQLVMGNAAASVATRQGSARAVRSMGEVPGAGRQASHAEVRSKAGFVGTSRSSGASRRSVAAQAGPERPWAKRDCRLVLSDGTVFEGRSFGATGTVVGEVVFNTSLTGYQEIMSDPSYAGQFVTFTHPHIGNTGTNDLDMESSKCYMKGMVIRDLPTIVSNYRNEKDIVSFCKEQGVVGIKDIDTRAVTRIVRNYGCLNAVITTDMAAPVEELVAKAKAFDISATDYIKEVTTKEPYVYSEATVAEWEFAKGAKASQGQETLHIVAYDFGIKTNILKRLASYNCKVTVVPADYPADKVLEMNPDGVFFSNGPGDPSLATYAVKNCEAILGKKPCFGICMGHQVMGQALGAKTFKLKFGHHGGNHPIRFNPTGRTEISAQNHNFAVDPAQLPADVSVTHINLNDGTCAGLMSATRKCLAIQYHPESSPGPHDADVCFDMFIELVRAEKAGKPSSSMGQLAAMA